MGARRSKSKRKRDDFQNLRKRYFSLRTQALNKGYSDAEFPRSRSYQIIARDERLDFDDIPRLQEGIRDEKSFVRLAGKLSEYEGKIRKLEMDEGYVENERARRQRLEGWLEFGAPVMSYKVPK